MADADDITTSNLFSLILGLIALVFVVSVFVMAISKNTQNLPDSNVSVYDIEEEVCPGVDFRTIDIDTILRKINNDDGTINKVDFDYRLLHFDKNDFFPHDLGDITIDNNFIKRAKNMCLAMQNEFNRLHSEFRLYEFKAKNDYQFSITKSINKNTKYKILCKKSGTEIEDIGVLSFDVTFPFDNANKRIIILKDDYSKQDDLKEGYFLYEYKS